MSALPLANGSLVPYVGKDSEAHLDAGEKRDAVNYQCQPGGGGWQQWL